MISDIEKQLSTPRKLPASSIGPEAKQRYDIVRAFCKKHGIVSTMEFIHPAELAKAPLNMSPKKIRKKIENSRVKQKSVVSLEQEVKDSVKIDIDERRENFKQCTQKPIYKYCLHELEVVPFLQRLQLGNLLVVKPATSTAFTGKVSSLSIFQSDTPSPTKSVGELAIRDQDTQMEDLIQTLISTRLQQLKLLPPEQIGVVKEAVYRGDDYRIADIFDGKRFGDFLTEHKNDIEIVVLSGYTLSIEFCLEIVDALKQCVNLAVLNISDCFKSLASNICQLSLLVLAVSKLPYLRSIELSRNALGKSAMEILIGVTMISSSLKEIKASDCGLNDDCFQYFLDSLAGSKCMLELLDLSLNRIGFADLSQFSNATIKLKNLRWLSLSGCCFDAERLQILLIGLRECKDLQYLNIGDNNLQAYGDVNIGLAALDVSSVLIDSLHYWPMLTELDMSACLFSKNHELNLADAFVQLKHLRVLHLSGNEELDSEFALRLLNSPGWIDQMQKVVAADCAFADDGNIVQQFQELSSGLLVTTESE